MISQLLQQNQINKQTFKEDSMAPLSKAYLIEKKCAQVLQKEQFKLK